MHTNLVFKIFKFIKLIFSQQQSYTQKFHRSPEKLSFSNEKITIFVFNIVGITKYVFIKVLRNRFHFVFFIAFIRVF